MVRGIALISLVLWASPAGAQDDDPPPLVRLGKYHIEEERNFRRLIHDGTLVGTQFHHANLHRLDVPNGLTANSPWDSLLLIGSLAVWDPRLEPLTYYHRTGPVGAVFYELRTRNGGRDGLAPIGVVGMSAGTMACYAQKGQTITFFESSPDLKKLVADTDRYITFIGDARLRGAKVDVQIGDARKSLETVKEPFAVLFVEMYDTGFDPGERMTLQAVKLYMDRVRDDGIVALHISNKYYRLEPVVAAIAAELKLAARIWNDDAEARPGKTASSWVVLARNEESLGALGKPTLSQIQAFGTRNELLRGLLQRHGPEGSARTALTTVADGQALSLEEFATKFGTEAQEIEKLLRKVGVAAQPSLEYVAEAIYGPMFHTLAGHPKVGVRKDGDKRWPRAALFLPRWLEQLLGPEDR